jgi:putative selenate reductase molybdopterin-binding subunit
MKKHFDVVGTSSLKVDGLALAKGKPLFADDIDTSDALIIKMLWSPVAHARITSIDTSAAKAMPGVHAVLTHEDAPRHPHTTAGQGYPEPSAYDSVILDNKVRFVGDRVAMVVAETRAIAEAAVKVIEVEYEELPAVFDPEAALEEGAPILHDQDDATMPIPVPYDPKRNLAGRADFELGDVDGGLERAEARAGGRFVTHYGTHCPIEPHVALAWLDAYERIVIRTSTQVPFHVRRIVAQALDIPVKQIHVIKPRIGGGFGGKQEVLIDDLVALAALRTGRMVKLEYTREEEFISSRTRHPQVLYLDVGAKQDGTLETVSMRVVMNTGAYGSHGLTVLTNTGSKVLPLYRWQNVRFDGSTAYTNLPVGGAYRGYGATQGAFAMEITLDELAAKLGMDPLALRQKNHIVSGESSPVFAALGEGKPGVEMSVGSCGLAECLSQGAEMFDWDEKFARPRDTGRYRRGVGMCALMQGSSIPEIDMAAATLKMNDDGSFNLLMGATDLGTGSDTVLSQVAAETLNVDLDDILPLSSDTDITPFDVGAYASSTSYLSGAAVIKASLGVMAQILEVAGDMLDVTDLEALEPVHKAVRAPDGREVSYAQIALYSLYEKNQFQIGHTASHISHKSPPPFSAHFVEVEVDTLTGKVKVLDYVATVDCGTALNPALAEGQVEGAVLNGLGYALTEEYRFSAGGRMLNPGFDRYRIPTAADTPPIRARLIPTYEDTGPYGAKSVSEIGINGPMPTISNAIFHATGARLRSSPFTPDRVLAALDALDTPE